MVLLFLIMNKTALLQCKYQFKLISPLTHNIHEKIQVYKIKMKSWDQIKFIAIHYNFYKKLCFKELDNLYDLYQ